MSRVIATDEAIEFRGVPAHRIYFEGSSIPGLYIDGCISCDRERANGCTFFPSHFASERCESGKHNHCTCDTCF